MEWTTDKPTQEGYYWVRLAKNSLEGEKEVVVQVSKNGLTKGKLIVYHTGNDLEFSIDDPEYIAWKGPL